MWKLQTKTNQAYTIEKSTTIQKTRPLWSHQIPSRSMWIRGYRSLHNPLSTTNLIKLTQWSLLKSLEYYLTATMWIWDHKSLQYVKRTPYSPTIVNRCINNQDLNQKNSSNARGVNRGVQKSSPKLKNNFKLSRTCSYRSITKNRIRIN